MPIVAQMSDVAHGPLVLDIVVIIYIKQTFEKSYT